VPLSDVEFEPTADPVAVLRDAAGRAPALDAAIAAAAETVELPREEGAADEPAR
jgi:hypothetical protein